MARQSGWRPLQFLRVEEEEARASMAAEERARGHWRFLEVEDLLMGCCGEERGSCAPGEAGSRKVIFTQVPGVTVGGGGGGADLPLTDKSLFIKKRLGWCWDGQPRRDS